MDHVGSKDQWDMKTRVVNGSMLKVVGGSAGHVPVV
jgi:hypothetical protein